MTPDAFVPEIVKEQDGPKPWAKWLPGSVLFADVSGFTRMTEALSALGAEGSEILSRILNRYFAEMIGAVHDSGGQVMKFGGDALQCLFPGRDTVAQALVAAQRMSHSMKRFQRISTPIQKFALQMKIGVSTGEILLAGVGDQESRCDYLFAGAPVDLSSVAEKHARAGEIIYAGSPKFPQCEDFSFKKSARGIYRLQAAKSPAPPFEHKKPHKTSSLDTKPYLIPEVYEMVRDGGYRRYGGALQKSVPVFLRFTGYSYDPGAFSLQSFQKFFLAVSEITITFQGRLNGVHIGDKGSNFFVLFGAPNQFEEKEEMACQWALEVRELIRNRFPHVRAAMGLAAGRTFSGVVGGKDRFDYTVVGDAVNLAARLTQMAGENEICVSGPVAEATRRNFLFDDLGFMQFKGKTELIQCFALRERLAVVASQPATKEEAIVGRQEEIARLVEHLELAASGSPRLVVIEGGAGLGKSFLANHVLNLARGKGFQILSGKSEITRQNHTYTPWSAVFRSLLFDGKKPTQARLRRSLKECDPALLKFVPWHADLLQLSQTESLTGFDENSKKTLFHHQLSRLLLQKIGKRPTVLFLDDLHYFDSLSLEVLTTLLNHLTGQPLLILAAARPEWKKNAFLHRPNLHFLTLNEMSAPAMKEMAEAFLSGPVRDDLIDFLYAQTKGNPFFTRQMLDYLAGSQLLTSLLGAWTIGRDTKLLADFSGREVVVAQLERLTMQEKIHARAAACMGPTFPVSVLKEALGKEFQLSSFDSLCSLGYLQPTDENWATFPHALIQETIYYSIPQRIRKQSHLRIGKAFETVLGKSKMRYVSNLANHFRLAGVRKKAIDYSIAAGNRLYKTLSFPEARTYFQHAYQLLNRTPDPRKWDVGLHLAETLIRVGSMKESVKLASSLRIRSQKIHLKEIFYRSCLTQFDAMRRLGDYGYLPFCQKLLRRRNGIRGSLLWQMYHLIGATYFWQGQSEEAERYLKKTIGVGGIAHREKTFSAFVYLSSIAANKQRFDDAFGVIEKALGLARDTGNLYQEILISNEWAGVLLDSGRSQDARRVLLDLIPRAEAFGDFLLLAGILINLGQAEIQHDPSRATATLEEALRLFTSMGVNHGRAKALLFLGVASFYREDFEGALQRYLDANQLFETSGATLETSYSYYNLAEVCMKLNRISDALRWYEKGLASFQARDNPHLAAMYQELQRGLESAPKQARRKTTKKGRD